MECPNCQKVLEGENHEFCWFCGHQLTDKALPEIPQTHLPLNMASDSRNPLVERYRDAYRVAGTIGAVGTIIKWTGGIFALIILLLTITLDQNSLRETSGSVTPAGICVALLIGSFFFVIGVVVSSQAQILMASLDTAVYNSTFLTNGDRAQAMMLPLKARRKAAPSV